MDGSDELEARGVLGVPGAADVCPALPPDEAAEADGGGGREGADDDAGLLAAVHLVVAVAGLVLPRGVGGDSAAGLDLLGGRGGRGHLVVVVNILVVLGGPRGWGDGAVVCGRRVGRRVGGSRERGGLRRSRGRRVRGGGGGGGL